MILSTERLSYRGVTYFVNTVSQMKNAIEIPHLQWAFNAVMDANVLVA
jgi:hypothetical protein